MNSGHEQLREWMVRAQLTQRAAAMKLGMHFTFLNQILGGRRSPALRTAVKIERVTGVPVEAWMPTVVEAPRSASAPRARKRRVYRA